MTHLIFVLLRSDCSGDEYSKNIKRELVILFGYNVVVPAGRDVNNMINRQNSSKILLD